MTAYRPNCRRIPELNGLRVLLVFIVSWYHFWQQSWLSPSLSVRLPFGPRAVFVSLDILPRTGYLFVDLLLLLSAFCLFLPAVVAYAVDWPLLAGLSAARWIYAG